MTDEERLLQSIDRIYEASYDPSRWSLVLELIGEITGSDKIFILYRDNELQASRMFLSRGVGANFLQEFNELWEGRDPYFDEMSKVPVGTAKATYQVYPDHDTQVAINPGFFDWINGHGIYYIAGVNLLMDPDHLAAVTIFRGPEQGKWDETHLTRLTQLAPHLQRALRIHKEFTRLRMREKALYTGLDKLVMGVILFDHLGQPVYANPVAKSILEYHPAIHLRDGTIYAARPEDTKVLRQHILDVARQQPGDAANPGIAIGLRDNHGSAVLPVMISPIWSEKIFADIDPDRVRVAIFFSDPESSLPLSPDAISSAYDLTPAEARVAVAIANGLSLEELAEQGGISVNTARSQLRSIFRKTDTSRQAELVKLLLTGPFGITS